MGLRDAHWIAGKSSREFFSVVDKSPEQGTPWIAGNIFQLFLHFTIFHCKPRHPEFCFECVSPTNPQCFVSDQVTLQLREKSFSRVFWGNISRKHYFMGRLSVSRFVFFCLIPWFSTLGTLLLWDVNCQAIGFHCLLRWQSLLLQLKLFEVRTITVILCCYLYWLFSA